MRYRTIALAMGIALGASASAQLINLGDFSGSETLIDFSPGFGFTTTYPVSYQGVLFSERGSGSGGAGLNATNNWGSYFDNIPGSSQGNALNDHWGQSLLKMEFTTAVRRVGILLSTTPTTTWTMNAYDAGGGLIFGGSRSMPADTDAVFLGLQSPGGHLIKYIEIVEGSDNGHISLADDLRFESVPEPATMAVLGLGVAALAARRRRK